VSGVKSSLPEALARSLKAAAAGSRSGGTVARLGDRDGQLWTGSEGADWPGWLDIVEERIREHDPLQKIANEVHECGFRHTLPPGMGGSSFCPEVLRMSFGRIPRFPDLDALDATVSGKPGTTLEAESPQTVFL
jgi:transaldolase / glucose-6-phosphate isomerase